MCADSSLRLSYPKARLTAGLRCPGPRGPDSNRHLSDGQSVALPVELPRGRTRGLRRVSIDRKSFFGTPLVRTEVPDRRLSGDFASDPGRRLRFGVKERAYV